MHPIHRGPALARAVRHAAKSPYVCSNCATRSFSQARPLQAGEDASPPQTPKPANRRQGAQVAGRMIQGLRSMAPGGFGKKVVRPPTSTTNQPRSSTPSAPDQTPRTSRSNAPRITRSQSGVPQQRGQRSNAGSAPASRRKDRDEEVEEKPVVARSAPDEGAKLVRFLNTPSDEAADIEKAQLARDRQLMSKTHGRTRRPVRFADGAEKNRVMEARRPNNRIAREKDNKEKFEPVFDTMPQKLRDALGAKVVAGKYEALKSVQAGKTAQDRTMVHLEASMQLNGSYSPAARQAMLDFMGQMWPGQARPKAA